MGEHPIILICFGPMVGIGINYDRYEGSILHIVIPFIKISIMFGPGDILEVWNLFGEPREIYTIKRRGK